MRTTIKRLWYWPIYYLDSLVRPRAMVPPRAIVMGSPGNFLGIGREFRGYLIDAGLQPDARVLDIGCGFGRLALALTDYLKPPGGYWGIDIMREPIHWCSNRIANKNEHFYFQRIDVVNKHYNPSSNIQLPRLPFDDNYFDCIVLMSVFTHMLPETLYHYAEEIERLLSDGGSVLATFFLLNPETRQLIEARRSKLDFHYSFDDCLVVNLGDPEAAIAYEENTIMSLFTSHGLSASIRHGCWRDEQIYKPWQDIVIARKNKSE